MIIIKLFQNVNTQSLSEKHRRVVLITMIFSILLFHSDNHYSRSYLDRAISVSEGERRTLTVWPGRSPLTQPPHFSRPPPTNSPEDQSGTLEVRD